MGLALRGQLSGTSFVLQLGDSAVTLSVGTDEVIAWDLGGRVYSAWRGGRTVRRGLSGVALEKWSDGEGRHRRHLPQGAIDETIDYAAERASAVTKFLQHRHPDEAALLSPAAAFDAAAARQDAARFTAVYGEVGILPPDQYLSLVVHATEGCAFSSCTFCDLYQRPFRTRSESAFEQHLRDVRAFMGPSLALRRRSVFLGAGNALLLPTDRLERLLAAIPEAIGHTAPVCGFIDAFSGTRKTAEDFRALGARGLSRVYVGLESGHDPLLAFVRKPGGADDAVRTVRAVKAAGLSVGVMVIVGLGGSAFEAGHVRDTVAVLNKMGLGTGDFVYFSDLVEAPTGAYAETMHAAGIRALTTAERIAQRQRIEGGLTFGGGRPRFARYDLGEFVY